jgi:hypothetical protein
MPLALARWTTGCSRLRMPPTLVRLPAAPSHGLALSYRVLRAPSRHPPFHALTCRTRGSSHEVCSPSAYPRTRQRPHGAACLTTPPAPLGFLDLSTLWSATCLSALFHAESAHGVAPYRALLPSRSRTPSPAPLPSWRWKHTLVQPAARRPETRRSTSRKHLERRAHAPRRSTMPSPETVGPNVLRSEDRSPPLLRRHSSVVCRNATPRCSPTDVAKDRNPPRRAGHLGLCDASAAPPLATRMEHAAPKRFVLHRRTDHGPAPEGTYP